MQFAQYLVLIRGGGDLATGAVYRLHKAGFPIIVLELQHPLVVRRRVALATAVLEGEVSVEGLIGRLVSDSDEALKLAPTGQIPVLISPKLPTIRSDLDKTPALVTDTHSFTPILVDARMAKRNIDTAINQAGLVVALGPGFTAGVDCHAVVETNRGHSLGRVIWKGHAVADTGTPGTVAGKSAERVLRAPISGIVSWKREIGDVVATGDLIGHVAENIIKAPFDGVLRGLIASGTEVPAGLKIGDLDPRKDVSACFTISDKALSVGGGVLEAILTWINMEKR